MRFSDLIKLALSTLWQQKLRTLLTTLGVVVGSFVLLASLSVRSGVDKRIKEEHARFRDLRQITVNLGQRFKDQKPPKEDLEIRGKMSEEKRERLRDEVILRWKNKQPSKAKVPLTTKRVNELRRIPHVVAVSPKLSFYGRAVLGTEAEYVSVVTPGVNDESFRKRIVAGEFFSSPDDRRIMVTEFLLYKLGIIDDADVTKAIGQKLRLEIRRGRPRPTFLAYLLTGSSTDVRAGDEELLGKIVKQLPEAIASLDLSDDEKAAMQRILKPPSPKKQSKDVTVTEEFRIGGVLRSLEPDEQGNRFYSGQNNADLLLTADTMAEMVFRVPELRERGFQNATAEVDQIENVKAVVKEIKSMELNARALIQIIERQQTMYALIFAAMSIVAVVSLLVAALGIANTMLTSVLERVREIGIMKAIGARDRHIQIIFLIEGALIGLFGGTLGTLLAWAASHPGDAWVQSMVQDKMSLELHGSVFAFPWFLLVGVPLFAAVVTTLAAYIPARRAARINPVTALRHE